MNFIQKHWIFDEYAKAFPHNVPSIYVQEQMLDKITDRQAWKDTVYFWIMNSFRGQSIGRMISYYEERIAEQSQGRWQDVGKYDASHISEPATVCTYCKSETCLSNHYEERLAN